MTETNKNLYLFRHSLATKSTRGYGKKILSADILPEGIASIKKLALFLKDITDTEFFSSKIKRCRQTTKIITKITHKKFQFDRRLNEYYHERFSDFKNRVKDFLESLVTSDHQNIVVCTHGMVIAGIKHFILENKFIWKNKLDYPQTGELVILENKTIRLINFNA